MASGRWNGVLFKLLSSVDHSAPQKRPLLASPRHKKLLMAEEGCPTPSGKDARVSATLFYIRAERGFDRPNVKLMLSRPD